MAWHNKIFGNTHPSEPREELTAPTSDVELFGPPCTQPPIVLNVMERENKDTRRPCWVRGKKALFHQWCSTARPVLPRGEQPDENTPHYQLPHTHGIVEFEDGSVERVWPQDIKFADGGGFAEYCWQPFETEDGADGDNQN